MYDIPISSLSNPEVFCYDQYRQAKAYSTDPCTEHIPDTVPEHLPDELPSPKRFRLNQ